MLFNYTSIIVPGIKLVAFDNQTPFIKNVKKHYKFKYRYYITKFFKYFILKTDNPIS